MYDIKKIVSIHITSAGWYFEYHPLGLVGPNLQLSLEETSSYFLSYWLTISGTNSPREGPAAAMVDLLWSKKMHIVQYCTKKRSTWGSIFEEAQHLRIPSFVDVLGIYVVARKQSFIITNIGSWGPDIHEYSKPSMKLIEKWAYIYARTR